MFQPIHNPTLRVLATALCAGWLVVACDRTNGEGPKNNPNGPESAGSREQDLSGAGVDRGSSPSLTGHERGHDQVGNGAMAQEGPSESDLALAGRDGGAGITELQGDGGRPVAPTTPPAGYAPARP